MASVLPHGANAAPFPIWAFVGTSFLCRPFFFLLSFPCAPLQRTSPSPCLASPSSHLPHLPMWPSPRRVWPSSSSVFEGRECPVVEVTLWRARLHGFVARPVLASRPTCSSAIWTSPCWATMDEGSRSLQMGCRSSAVPNWRLTPRPMCATHDGVALAQARRRKQRTYPEFGGAGTSSLGGLGRRGRRTLVRGSPAPSSTNSPRLSQIGASGSGRAGPRQAWQHRWASLLACASARAFVLSLLHPPPSCRF